MPKIQPSKQRLLEITVQDIQAIGVNYRPGIFFHNQTHTRVAEKLKLYGLNEKENTSETEQKLSHLSALISFARSLQNTETALLTGILVLFNKTLATNIGRLTVGFNGPTALSLDAIVERMETALKHFIINADSAPKYQMF